MKTRQVLVFSGALAAMVMLTIGVAYGMGMGCGMGSGSHDQAGDEMASMPGMADQSAMTDTATAMGCPMMNMGARVTMKDVPNGVQIVLTASDSAVVESIRAHARHILAMREKMTDSNTGRVQSSEGRNSRTQSQSVTYTCPMHPEVVSARPGSCPKCGMTLVAKRG
jgi:hypothetical protein